MTWLLFFINARAQLLPKILFPIFDLLFTNKMQLIFLSPFQTHHIFTIIFFM
uniref:Uncharacterized protein n=1 Tax=Mesocestoides corti TaxID=53468 RepID=A0A5K3FT31_MESCO